MKPRFLTGTVVGVFLFCGASPAFAHPGHGEDLGLVGGLIHPFTGIDHLVAMILVGAWASRLPIRRSWRAPTVFISAMIAGFGTARLGIALPADALIAVSLLALPLLAVMAPRLPLVPQFAGVALFGLAHGFAHGAEVEGSAVGFFAGMTVATALLHAAGYLAGKAIGRGTPARA